MKTNTKNVKNLKEGILNVTYVKKFLPQRVVSKITFLASMMKAKTSSAKYVKKNLLLNLLRKSIQKPFMKME